MNKKRIIGIVIVVICVACIAGVFLWLATGPKEDNTTTYDQTKTQDHMEDGAMQNSQDDNEGSSDQSVREMTTGDEAFIKMLEESNLPVLEDPSPGDQDWDGLPDEDEKNIYGTSISNHDTDGDGISDGDEVNRWGSDPTSIDSDGDGFLDGWEIYQGYSPTGPGRLETPNQ